VLNITWNSSAGLHTSGFRKAVTADVGEPSGFASQPPSFNCIKLVGDLPGDHQRNVSEPCHQIYVLLTQQKLFPHYLSRYLMSVPSNANIG
jgi:hypothetical protein